MARYPKIDCPCPLDISEQLRIDGYCGHCTKAVHGLDLMDDHQREQLLAGATGPICVSYRLPASRAAALGFAMAGVMSAGTAMADEFVLTPPAQVQRLQPAAVPACSADEDLETVVVTGGGISDPANAEWVSDDSLPDIPTRSEAAFAYAEADNLTMTVFVGGVENPKNAAWTSDDVSLPELPVIYETITAAPRNNKSSR